MYAFLESWPRNPVARAAAAAWSELPLLLSASAAVAGLWVLCRTDPLLLGAAEFAVMPTLTALAVTFHSALEGERSGILRLLSNVCRAAPATWLLSLPATVAALLADAAFQLAEVSGQAWMLLSGGAGLAVSVIAAATGLLAMPLAALDKVTARAAWMRAWAAALRHPAPALGAVGAYVLAMLASAHLSFAVLLLLPIPLVSVWVAAFRASGIRTEAA
ncbi:hypothetical protein [Microbacterium hydrocarbonoxydans]|uniref:hypothetical protein n=1 Tax=Microbacterium hydrocarbonoxydans TaxID=273678 RepID=UPI003D98F15B